ncbi:UDP-N-acetylmuramoyl-L-alanine--D-glutamate ligase [Guyparkeria hydrothermalis]|uniref:UDP-N-acetylmuramoyl-L-alanine--D-glutamate ligase n=1 Tax=Guyparkeria hydrothermalis TaxID=923 RepID=UPI0020204C45|nr:UDP-N-acetylmuramoyl-L-alanine--D-glutamate ligase [Guyparkeria hydrothermalis]MCL7744513.1 UDP-N-acetylmuramoyl-L-alanine--D-glutamate ligase [Guyparkeria hydrothermalis]
MKLIIGMGQTGFSAGRFFQRRGEAFVAVDTRGAAAPREVWLRTFGQGTVYDGPLTTDMFDAAALRDVTDIVLSPGLNPASSPLRQMLAEAARRGIRVASDIALALRYAEVPYLLVTGSNGKSTVTALTAELLTALGYRVGIGGNYGTPALDLLAEPADVLVLEVSSFQLEACRAEEIHARAATVLNISADHLDRHGTIDVYAALKQKLVVNAETAVINLDDPIVRAMGSTCQGRIVGFSATPEADGMPVKHHFYLDSDGEALCRDDQVLLDGASLALPGSHNRINVLATLALVEGFAGRQALGNDALRQALESFAGLPHRMQVICTRSTNGTDIRFINDSKATNVGAAIAAVEGLAAAGVAHQLVIAGGQAKGQSFDEFARTLVTHADGVVLIGEDAGAIERSLQQAADTKAPAVYRAESMQDAVAWAAGRAEALAAAGDSVAVLLSPACASFDMFRGYADRGECFARASETACVGVNEPIAEVLS